MLGKADEVETSVFKEVNREAIQANEAKKLCGKTLKATEKAPLGKRFAVVESLVGN